MCGWNESTDERVVRRRTRVWRLLLRGAVQRSDLKEVTTAVAVAVAGGGWQVNASSCRLSAQQPVSAGS